MNGKCNAKGFAHRSRHGGEQEGGGGGQQQQLSFNEDASMGKHAPHMFRRGATSVESLIRVVVIAAVVARVAAAGRAQRRTGGPVLPCAAAR